MRRPHRAVSRQIFQQRSSSDLTSTAAGPSSAPAPPPSQFPGGGHTLGAPPRSTPVPAQRPQQQQQPSQRSFSERDIQTLMDLGVSREVAISTLDAAGGNVDVAASLLF